MKRKILSTTLLVIMSLAFCLLIPTESVQAESLKKAPAAATKKVAATNSNGYYMYYEAGGEWDNNGSYIYRMNTKTGSVKQIYKTKKGSISNVLYYKGYLYFEFYSGSVDSSSICRVKTNGKNFKKLGQGQTLAIYDGKVYYTKDILDYDGYRTGNKIMSMKTDGSGKKSLISRNDGYLNIVGVAKGKIYYASDNTIRIASLNGKNRKTIIKKDEGLYGGEASIVGNDLYYCGEYACSGAPLYQYNLTTKKEKCLVYVPYVMNLTVRSGEVYYTTDDAVKKINIKTEKITTIKKVRNYAYIDGFELGKGSYMVLYHSKEATGKDQTNQLVARITTSGKKYKVLKKWWCM